MPRTVKLYRNHVGSEGDSSGGYRWFETEDAARAEANRNPEDYQWQFGTIAEEFEFQFSKRGILRLLRFVASYNDNG